MFSFERKSVGAIKNLKESKSPLKSWNQRRVITVGQDLTLERAGLKTRSKESIFNNITYRVNAKATHLDGEGG